MHDSTQASVRHMRRFQISVVLWITEVDLDDDKTCTHKFMMYGLCGDAGPIFNSNNYLLLGWIFIISSTMSLYFEQSNSTDGTRCELVKDRAHNVCEAPA